MSGKNTDYEIALNKFYQTLKVQEIYIRYMYNKNN